MAQTYAEHLRAEGATDEDIKLLDTPLARKAFEKQQAAAVEAKRKSDEVIAANNQWRQEVEDMNQKYLRERDTALADAEAERARLNKLRDLGLVQVAENLEPGSTRPRENETPAIDPKLLERYVDRDTLMQVAEREGDAIAIAQDISFEHAQLFGNDPSKRLNFRELRREALSRKMSVEQLWMEKFGVQSAREAANAKAQSERDAKIAADAVIKYKSEHPETNPLMATPSVSRTPFTDRIPSAASASGDKRQPWQKSDSEREQARLRKVMDSMTAAGIVN